MTSPDVPTATDDEPRPGPAQQARNQLTVLLLCGALLLVIGGGIALAGLPRHDAVYGGVQPGDATVVVIGGILAGIGQLLVLVAIIGFGVMLGVRAAGRDPEPAVAVPPGPGGSVGSAP